GNHFNQSMSIPMEIKLLETSEGLRISRQPIEALKDLRESEHQIEETKIQNNIVSLGGNIQGDLLEINVQFSAINAQEIEFSIKGVEMVYDVMKQTITVDGVQARLPILNNKLDLRIYVDRT